VILASIGTGGIYSHNINGKISAGNASGYINLWNGASGNMELVTTSNHNMTFSTNNTERVRINNSGSVGIGTTSPSASLHISGASSNVLLEIDSPAVNNILFVSGSGNVGIGTATPAAKLDVIGGTRIGNGTITLGLGESSGDSVFVGSVTNHPLKFVVNTNEYMRILTSGNVGIGTTTPTAKLAVKGSGTTSATTSFLVQNANASGSFTVLDDGSAGIGTATPIGGGGLTVANPAYTGYGRMYMSANTTFVVADNGTGGNITFGPSNRIFINTPQLAITNGYISIGSGVAITANSYAQGTTFTVSNYFANNIGTSAGIIFSSNYVRNGAGGPNTGTAIRITDTNINTSAGVTNAMTMLAVDPLVNTTGGSTTLRGIYYNPNMSSSVGLTQHTAIETTAGSVLFNGGNVGIGISTPTTSLHISGASAVLTLAPQSPLPSGVPTGSFAVSSSVPPKPYFYDGTTWNALY
jgi:hypothetical protein